MPFKPRSIPELLRDRAALKAHILRLRARILYLKFVIANRQIANHLFPHI